MNLYEIFRGILGKQTVGTPSGGVHPLQNKNKSGALSKSRISGSTGHSMSYNHRVWDRVRKPWTKRIIRKPLEKLVLTLCWPAI
jgi:hypothetical protein